MVFVICIVSKVVSDFANFNVDDPESVYVCVCVWGGGCVSVCLSVCMSVCLPANLPACLPVCLCMSLESDSSGTIEVTIITLDTVTVSDILMRHGLIILTLAFIQVHIDLNDENNKCLIISKTIQAIPIMFLVLLVRLKVYRTVSSLMTLIFTQGHNWVSNLTVCNLQYFGYYLSY